MRIIVTGLIAQHPLGGVTWDYVQYVVGLARLGHDVFYFEDSGLWPYAIDGGPSGTNFNVSDGIQNAAYLSDVMTRFGLGERWAYRCAIDWRWFGLSDVRRRAVIESADLLINVSSTVVRPDEYRCIPRLAFIDSDPVFTQIKLARGQMDFRSVVNAHDVHFSFGESLSQDVPVTGHHWRPTRQPILLSEWHPSQAYRDVFTTVMNWDSYNVVRHRGVTYGQKDVEFIRFVDLPLRVEPHILEVAARGTSRRELPEKLLSHLTYKKWRMVDPGEVCADLDGYRAYIESSKAEWSIAKNGYVVGRPGWFSCRSACYLAAGRPVVVQDTGFADALPAGEGILPFRTLDEAVEQIRAAAGDYQRHARAARAIAEAYFDSGVVLSALVEQAMTAGLQENAREAVR